ncbi:uncharacterized protein [Porites lutea]|uniref:uncharacterized protein n=1 Tax=Porites lutea TaxID=51062 RepID=UPI003CC64748
MERSKTQKMYNFFIGIAIFMCQFHGAKFIPVCRQDQIEKYSAQCATYLKYGFCTAANMRHFMEQNCPVTCTVCQVVPPSTTSPPTSTQPATTTMPATTTLPPTSTPFPTKTSSPTIPACMPNHTDIPTCVRYAKMFGFCTSSVNSIRKYMFQNCAVTCGFCRVRHTTTPQQTTNQSKTTPYSSTGDKTTSKPTTKQRETLLPAAQQPSITWPTINMDLEAWKSRCYNYVSFSTAPSDQASFLDTNTFIHANL